MTLPHEESSLAVLEKSCSAHWEAIRTAKEDARKARQKVEDAITEDADKLASSDVSLVVFGSLARDEYTNESDVDWTLLIDGFADPEHLAVAKYVEGQLEKIKLHQPGPTGTFGNLAFSHQLVQQIGGIDDTNINTTQRVLLLLKSRAIKSAEAHRRVLRAVLRRYVEEEAGTEQTSEGSHRVPRFLLNDIARFWRTMAVDFARKVRERGGWGLRNAKLRMSRKLIFASGLLTCFSCTRVGQTHDLAEYLERYFQSTPLEILAKAVLEYREDQAPVVFGAYDRFLSMLSNPKTREHLKKLSADAAREDAVFEEVREISHAFQNGLTALFFESELRSLTVNYGVF